LVHRQSHSIVPSRPPTRLATRKHAVCFVGDGGSLFSIHALWTAAKYAIPSIFICFVNHEYRLLKDLWCNVMGGTIETTRFVGMDFEDPSLNMQGIAEGSEHVSRELQRLIA
jgi:benzoylformate decarboxylase